MTIFSQADFAQQTGEDISGLEALFAGPIVTPLHYLKRGVCRAYGIEKANIEGRSGDRKYSHPRQVYCWLARELTDKSLQAIGYTINRTHSTVLLAHRKIADFVCADDAQSARAVELLKRFQ